LINLEDHESAEMVPHDTLSSSSPAFRGKFIALHKFSLFIVCQTPFLFISLSIVVTRKSRCLQNVQNRPQAQAGHHVLLEPQKKRPERRLRRQPPSLVRLDVPPYLTLAQLHARRRRNVPLLQFLMAQLRAQCNGPAACLDLTTALTVL
jgi:hypothetical protein